MNPKHLELISQALSIRPQQVRNTVALLSEGATLPFIARYRKEVTGSLDEVQIADIRKQSQQLTDLEKRRESILASIEEQGKLTDGLRARITATYNSTELEDLYLPYKRKRKPRASVARERGLEPLAQAIFEQDQSDPERLAAGYLNDEVPNAEEALQGARDIIAEWVNEHEQARNKARFLFDKSAQIRAKVARGKEEAGAKYRDYFDFEEPLKRCPSHRLLAIRRGEDEGFLRVGIRPDEEEALYRLNGVFVKGHNAAGAEVKAAVQDAYRRLLEPSIETEFRNSSKAKADEEAIAVFAENLRQLLLTAPLGQRSVLAIDPGYRTVAKSFALMPAAICCITAPFIHILHSQKASRRPSNSNNWLIATASKPSLLAMAPLDARR